MTDALSLWSGLRNRHAATIGLKGHLGNLSLDALESGDLLATELEKCRAEVAELRHALQRSYSVDRADLGSQLYEANELIDDQTAELQKYRARLAAAEALCDEFDRGEWIGPATWLAKLRAVLK